MLFTLGYINEFKKLSGRTIKIISNEKYESLLKYYPELDCNYISISDLVLDFLLSANRCGIGRQLFKYFGNVTVVEPGNLFSNGFEDIKCFPEITLRKCIKYGVLKLPFSSNFMNPSFIDELEKLEKDRVLLFPDAQSIRNETVVRFLKIISEACLEKGYKVVINGNLHDCFGKKDIYVDWSLDDFIKQSQTLCAVIGVRSGFLDLAAYANIKVIALYPLGYDEKMMSFFDIEDTNSKNKNVYQYRLTNNSEVDLKMIFEFLDKNEFGVMG